MNAYKKIKVDIKIHIAAVFYLKLGGLEEIITKLSK